MLLDIALYIYIAGIVATSLYHLWGFSQGVRILKSGSAAVFIGLETIKSIIKAFLWPCTGLIFLLQLPFSKGTLDDFNESFANHVGYDLEDDGEDD